MIRRPPRSTRTDTLFPYTTLVRSEGAREVVLRVAEAGAEFGDAVEAKDVAARRQRGKAVELGLDGGVAGMGVVGHGDSAFESPSPSGGDGSESSEERSVGQECVSTCRSRGSPDH